jgi:hypothetical protein
MARKPGQGKWAGRGQGEWALWQFFPTTEESLKNALPLKKCTVS